MRIAVLGGGSWGTALANLLACKGNEVIMLMRSEECVESINKQHENTKYLPGLALHSSLSASTSAQEAFEETALTLLAVPCQSMRAVLREHSKFLVSAMPLVCASKGLELGSLKTMSGVVQDELPDARYAILSGPSFADEVTRGLPAAVVLGCADKALGDELQAVFSGDMFRVYLSNDVTGVEVGGAIKNVMAIAAGVADELGFGYNARAGLITRGLAEISRLGVAMGARAATFMGLSGMGDLVLTCTGDLSRNRQVGLALGRGQKLDDIIASMHMVAEGVKTTEAAVRLGDSLGVDLPIAGTVKSLLDGETSALEAVKMLMGRGLKEE